MVRATTLVLRPAEPCLRTRSATQSSDRAARTTNPITVPRMSSATAVCLDDVVKLTLFGV